MIGAAAKLWLADFNKIDPLLADRLRPLAEEIMSYRNQFEIPKFVTLRYEQLIKELCREVNRRRSENELEGLRK